MPLSSLDFRRLELYFLEDTLGICKQVYLLYTHACLDGFFELVHQCTVILIHHRMPETGSSRTKSMVIVSTPFNLDDLACTLAAYNHLC